MEGVLLGVNKAKSDMLFRWIRSRGSGAIHLLDVLCPEGLYVSIQIEDLHDMFENGSKQSASASVLNYRLKLGAIPLHRHPRRGQKKARVVSED